MVSSKHIDFLCCERIKESDSHNGYKYINILEAYSIMDTVMKEIRICKANKEKI